jgi:uncharacterized protein
METPWLFYLLALVAEILGTLSGFGSSILFVPLAAYFFDFNLVLGITAVFHVFSNLSKIYLFQKGMDKNILIKLGVPAVIFVILGALLTRYVPAESAALMMNISLILLSLFLLITKNASMTPTNNNLIASGMLSGFLAGLIGTGGAIRGLALTAFNLEKNAFIATSAMIDLGVDMSRAVIYIWNGFFKLEFVVMIPFLMGISLLGSWIGKKILEKLSQAIFRNIVLFTILATTAFQLLKQLDIF